MISGDEEPRPGSLRDPVICPFVHELSDRSRSVLESAARPVSARKGEVLLREGDRCDPMLLVSEVAFARMDQQLAKLLLARSGSLSSGSGDLRVTHQELADELGTAREVVSRILRWFADQGLVTVSGGHVRLVDERELQTLIQEEG
jgi:CRP-like cAMP-binding protein